LIPICNHTSLLFRAEFQAQSFDTVFQSNTKK
jgi:hypothetical protein